MAPSDGLALTISKLAKAELVEFVVDMARENSGVRRKLETRFRLEPSDRDLVRQTRAAIADATDFDEREINRNFDYDYGAYETVKRNFGRLVRSGSLREAMKLSIELMEQGSCQVEMSDEGLMTYDIEDCLRVVIKALEKSALPDAVVHAWCDEMVRKDRVKFICNDDLRALQARRGANPPR